MGGLYILVRHRVQGSTGFRTPRALGCSVPKKTGSKLNLPGSKWNYCAEVEEKPGNKAPILSVCQL